MRSQVGQCEAKVITSRGTCAIAEVLSACIVIHVASVAKKLVSVASVYCHTRTCHHPTRCYETCVRPVVHPSGIRGGAPAGRTAAPRIILMEQHRHSRPNRVAIATHTSANTERITVRRGPLILGLTHSGNITFRGKRRPADSVNQEGLICSGSMILN